MTRPIRILLIVTVAGAAGVAAGLVARFTTDLGLLPPDPTRPAPDMPGLPRPASAPDRTIPGAGTPEGRLLEELRRFPGQFSRERLFGHLVHPHPAVRDLVVQILGARCLREKDPLVEKALRSRWASERDPAVRSSLKTALRDLTGENPREPTLP